MLEEKKDCGDQSKMTEIFAVNVGSRCISLLTMNREEYGSCVTQFVHLTGKS